MARKKAGAATGARLIDRKLKILRGSVAHAHARHAPAIAVPQALAGPETARATHVVVAVVEISVVGTAVAVGWAVVKRAIGPRCRRADNGAGRETAEDAADDATRAVGIGGGGSGKRCHRERCGSRQ